MTEDVDTAGWPAASKRAMRSHLIRTIAASVVLPLIALAVQGALWPVIGPHVWFLLFYPAVFATSWIAGPRAGLGATMVSCVLVWWGFVPPVFELGKDPQDLIPFAMFATMGALFAGVHERLRTASRQAAEALAASATANQEIARLLERTKELDQLKTAFFANVSHELRTPLTLILGTAHRLREGPALSPTDRRDLEVIVRNARTLLRHVNDLLEVVTLESGRLAPAYADAELGRLARFVAGQFEVLAEEQHLAFTVDAPDGLRAQVDPDQLRRILINLLSNAFKFTPPDGRVRLTVRVDRGRATIEVADSGPGIPPAERAAVFERFRQLEVHAARRFGGTGLGLAIAHELVTLHRGTIAVDDAPEGGALFRVELPATAPAGAPVAAVGPVQLDPEAAQVVDELRARPRDEVAPGPAEGRARVLVVEDNVEMSRFVCDVLARDHHVIAAFDGKQGLARARELVPDLIVTDMMMPVMSGEELVRAIRAQPALARTPIVVLTAKADDELRVRLLRDGAQDYVTKPFEAEELRVRVTNLLRATAVLALEERMAALVAESSDGIFVANLAGRYTDVNPAGCQLLGYTRDELVGMSIVELIPPADLARLERSKAHLLAGERDIAEWTLRHKDGTWVPVEVNGRISPDGRWQGFVRDLTERKRAEAALAQAQERYELALRGADLGAWDWNVQTGEVIFDPRWCEMRGYRPDEVVPHVDSWSAGIHPDDLPHVRAALDDYFEGRAPTYEAEFRARAKHGGWIWVLDRGRVFARDPQRRPRRMVGTELDITHRKLIEEALRVAEARASSLLAVSADAIITIDGDQRITAFNAGAERLFGYAADEVAGASLELPDPRPVSRRAPRARRPVHGGRAGRPAHGRARGPDRRAAQGRHGVRRGRVDREARDRRHDEHHGRGARPDRPAASRGRAAVPRRGRREPGLVDRLRRDPGQHRARRRARARRLLRPRSRRARGRPRAARGREPGSGAALDLRRAGADPDRAGAPTSRAHGARDPAIRAPAASHAGAGRVVRPRRGAPARAARDGAARRDRGAAGRARQVDRRAHAGRVDGVARVRCRGRPPRRGARGAGGARDRERVAVSHGARGDPVAR